MNEQYLQAYLDGGIYRLKNGYEVCTSHGTGKGSTVAEALKDLADKQVEVESKANDDSLNIDSEDVKQEAYKAPEQGYSKATIKQEPVEKPKKRKSTKKKKQTD